MIPVPDLRSCAAVLAACLTKEAIEVAHNRDAESKDDPLGIGTYWGGKALENAGLEVDVSKTDLHCRLSRWQRMVLRRPVDAVTGLPTYFESALVAQPGYYDRAES